LLSGIKEPAQFERLRTALAAFPDEPLTAQDHECAAGFFNICKAKGIQGSHTDFLICAVAKQRNLPVFSLDQDFVYFSVCFPISLFRHLIYAVVCSFQLSNLPLAQWIWARGASELIAVYLHVVCRGRPAASHFLLLRQKKVTKEKATRSLGPYASLRATCGARSQRNF
jgi:hypothetical protein